MIDVPDPRALALLRDVATLGSIGAAGRAQGITQQSASERLRVLESQVGLSLLRRSPTGSSLTEHGRLVAGWAEKALDQLDALTAAVRTLRDDRDAVVRVAASLTVAEHLLPAWLVALRAERDTSARLVATNSEHVRSAVLAGEADVGFVEDGIATNGASSMVVARDRLGLFCSPADTWATVGSVGLQDVATRPLTWREEGSGTRQVVEHRLREAGHRIARPEVELTTTAAVRGAVVVGSPPAFLSALAVQADVAAGVLVEVTVTGLELRRDLVAVWTGSTRPPAGPVRDLLAIATRRPG